MVYERPNVITQYPFCDNQAINIFEFTSSSMLATMGLAQRKKLAKYTFDELCLGSKNSKDYKTRMRQRDIPLGLERFLLSICIFI